MVAVDGPAGSGKSSVSRAAARRLGFDYQDTGAAYRALAWNALERGVDLDDADAILDVPRRLRLPHRHRPGPLLRAGRRPRRHRRHPRAAGDRRRERRRADPGGAGAARRGCSATSSPRSTKPGIVIEGRDITTVVAPDASVRILLTAIRAG